MAARPLPVASAGILLDVEAASALSISHFQSRAVPRRASARLLRSLRLLLFNSLSTTPHTAQTAEPIIFKIPRRIAGFIARFSVCFAMDKREARGPRHGAQEL